MKQKLISNLYQASCSTNTMRYVSHITGFLPSLVPPLLSPQWSCWHMTLSFLRCSLLSHLNYPQIHGIPNLIILTFRTLLLDCISVFSTFLPDHILGKYFTTKHVHRIAFEKLTQNSSRCKLCSLPHRSENPSARMLWQYDHFPLFDTVIMKIFMVKM